MLEAALYAALGVAVLSAFAGVRTAWILLASVAFCLVLDQAGVAFHPLYWMMFDLVVVVLIIRPSMSHADCVIISLFIPGWVFYVMPDEQRYLGSMLVAIVQLLLTFPVANAWKRIKRMCPAPDRDNFNPRAIHAGAY